MIAPFVRPESATLIPGHTEEPEVVADPHEALPADRRPGTDASGSARRPPAQRKDGSGGSQRTAAPAAGRADDLGRLLALLADPTRLQILRILATGERPVVTLTAELRLPQPTVSHHLAWLRMMELVSPRRQGKHIFYSLGPTVDHADDGTLTLRANEATVTIRPRAAR